MTDYHFRVDQSDGAYSFPRYDADYQPNSYASVTKAKAAALKFIEFQNVNGADPHYTGYGVEWTDDNGKPHLVGGAVNPNEARLYPGGGVSDVEDNGGGIFVLVIVAVIIIGIMLLVFRGK